LLDSQDFPLLNKLQPQFAQCPYLLYTKSPFI